MLVDKGNYRHMKYSLGLSIIYQYYTRSMMETVVRKICKPIY